MLAKYRSPPLGIVGKSARGVTSALAFCASSFLAGCGGGGGTAQTSPQPISAPPPSGSAEFQNNVRPFTLIHVDSAHDARIKGAGSIVGIVDDGLDVTNPEFEGRISSLSKDFGFDQKRDPVSRVVERFTRSELGDENSSHGIKVASILAAGYNSSGLVGVAPSASIAVLRANIVDLATGSSTYTNDTVAAAIRYAGQVGIKVLNISLATAGRSDVVVSATESFARTDGLMVWSAGNVGASSPDTIADVTPINRGNWISVGGIVPTSEQIHFQSNRAGSFADRFLVAPMILQAQFADGSVQQVTGTSFAAPQVAGAAALLLGRWPQLSGKQAGDILLQTARDLGDPGTDPIYGRGLLDIAAAMKPLKPNFGDGQSQSVVEKISLAMPSGFGVSDLQSALSEVTILDSYGRDYTASLANFVTSTSPLRTAGEQLSQATLKGSRISTDDVSGFIGFRSRGQTFDGGRDRWALSNASFAGRIGQIDWRASYGGTADPVRSAAASYAPLANKHFAIGLPTGGPTLLLDASGGGRTQGASLGIAAGSSIFRLGMIRENDTLFGSFGAGTLRLGAGARTGFVDAESRVPLSDSWSLRASGSVGVTRVDVASGSIFRSVGALLTTRAAIDLEGIVNEHVMVRIGAAQPITVERGAGQVVLPIGYNVATRSLILDRRRISLSADERPLMLSGALTGWWTDDTMFRVGISQMLDGATAASLRAAWTF